MSYTLITRRDKAVIAVENRLVRIIMIIIKILNIKRLFYVYSRIIHGGGCKTEIYNTTDYYTHHFTTIHNIQYNIIYAR